ncbi:hypothetical protein U0070_002097 [Myodes glareolus]|uniref:Sharpin n=1 Tax=Myodes glareolus TaxID=447135 RepID=A0AAW0H4W3_MYOGA
MAPPAGGAAAPANPSSPAVLLAVQAAVRPLGAGHDTEAQLRRLQLSADPERPGRFRLGLLGTGPGAVSLEWPLESICYTVRGPNQHELQPPPGGPGTFSVHFLNSQEAQQWAALVRDATAEGQNGNGSQAPAPEMCPLSPPCSSVAQIPKATQPEVDLLHSSGNLKKEELATRLAQAIADGDEKEAAHVAAILAQHHVALNVQLMEAWFPPGPIRLQVTVEDATSVLSSAASAHVSLQIHPHCSIAALQEKVFSEFGFPPAVQRWVIGRCLCVPERSLASYGISQDGDPAFLYLLSAPREASGHSPQHSKMDGKLGCLFPQSLEQPHTLQPTSSSLPNPPQVTKTMAIQSQTQVPEPPPLKYRRGPLFVGDRDAVLRNKGHKPVIKDTQEPARVLVLVQSYTSTAAWEQGNRFCPSVADGAPQTTTRRLQG